MWMRTDWLNNVNGSTSVGLNGGMISVTGIFLGGAIFMLIKYGLVEIKANPYFANSFLGASNLIAYANTRVPENGKKAGNMRRYRPVSSYFTRVIFSARAAD